MSTTLYHCLLCLSAIDRHEQTKVHTDSEGKLLFFHVPCFIGYEAKNNNMAFYRSQQIAREFADGDVL